MAASGSGQIVARNGRSHLHLQDTGGQEWRPRMRHERHFSSAAGDASDASTAANVLGSIHEAEGDAPVLVKREIRTIVPEVYALWTTVLNMQASWTTVLSWLKEDPSEQ